MTPKITNIPHFLSARSPLGLRRLMLKNNLKHDLIFDYYQIYRDHTDNKLYAWFQLDAVITLEEEVRDLEAKDE